MASRSSSTASRSSNSRRDPSANRPDRATPEIALIPASLLHDGANDLAIRLYIWGPIAGFLDRLYVGPDEALRHFYEERTLLFVTLPMVFAAWQGILAVILIVLWAVRRHEVAYGALAAAMGLGAIQAFLPSAMDQPTHPELNATLIASAPLESSFVLAFAILFFGRRWPRYAALIFVPGVLLALVGPVRKSRRDPPILRRCRHPGRRSEPHAGGADRGMVGAAAAGRAEPAARLCRHYRPDLLRP